MRVRFVGVPALVAALAAGTALAAAGPTPNHDFTEAPAAAQAASDYVIVTFKDPPAASYAGGIRGLERTKPEKGQKLDPRGRAVRAYVDHLSKVHNDYRGYLSNKAASAQVVSEVSLVGNALAVKLNGSKAETLTQGPGVRTVTPSAIYRPTMNVSTDLIDADVVWPAAGGRANAGDGMKVGIIDSGIDDTHKFFDCKGPIPHKTYASGVKQGDVLVNDHGTHVSGTVAGCVITLTPADGPITGDISGVAPKAQLFDYNVFPGTGAPPGDDAAFSHDIIDALEDSVEDGMDVDNMSLGGGVQGPHDALADAVNATVDAGIVVAVAAGNSGPGDMTIESPGSAAGALTAGASTNPHFIGIPFSAIPSSGAPVAGGAALGDFNNFGDTDDDGDSDGPVTDDYLRSAPLNGCTAFTNAADIAGKIALINRGVCTFTTKVRNAQSAGAVGVLVANNVAGDPVAMAHDGTDPFPTIPAAMVSKNDGAALGTGGTVTIDGTAEEEFKTTNSDIIAGFSSRGPSPFNFLIKPDVTGPGVNVYSSVFLPPNAPDGFAMFSGTSMATPHVAGAAALLLQLNPDWSPADVKSALVNTAKRPVWDHVNGTAPTGVLTRGGGRIDLDAANSIPMTFDPASASFGLWTGNKDVSATLPLAVKNVSSGAQACTVVVEGSTASTSVTASPSSFALAPGGSTTLNLTLNGGKKDQTASGDYSGDAVVTCGGTALRVPWWTRVDRGGKP